jgi:predicted helicase
MEIFVEALLNTHPIFQTVEVYPNCDGVIPEPISRKLNLTGDYGVDGVFRGNDQLYDAYQSKFRAPRGEPVILNYGAPDELSHLFADGLRCRSRLVISNADDVVAQVRGLDGVRLFLRTDFLALNHDDVAAALSFINDTPAEREKFSPLPHQAEALEHLHPIGYTSSRMQLIMPPGTGKTLVGLWAAEQHIQDSTASTQIVVVFEPSLALVKQVLEQWLRHAETTPKYQIICSDRTVERSVGSLESDIWDINPEDFSGGVVTNPEEVAKFIQDAEGFTLIMSTYQSVEVLEEAVKLLADEGFEFDFGVFDEAHHTAGVGENGLFQRALFNENVPIDQRLFMTATPRVISRRRREGDSKSITVLSMDNPEIFGEIAHELKFSDAINPNRERGQIIANFQVIIAEARSEDMKRARIELSNVDFDGEVVSGEFAVAQFALIRAMNGEATEGEPIAKAFTFHNRVERSRYFSTHANLGICARGADIVGFHIDGSMNSRTRASTMQQFESADRAILSNANCLVEGVDLPSVDMVAFIDPRRSTTQIVQAVGRALRIPPGSGKTTGYVLIPVVRSDGEDSESIISASSYAKIGDVIDQLSQYDQTLDEILREERRDRGRRGGLIGGRLRERIRWIGFEDIPEDILYNDTTVVLVESLVKNVWEIWGRIEQFLRENPDLDGWIPNSISDRNILRDAYAFRMQHTNGTLPPELRDAAEQVGFRWRSPRGQPRTDIGAERRPRLSLNEQISLLEAGIRQHGSVDIPRNLILDGTGIFPETERYQRRDGSLWDWPVGRLINNLRMAARGQKTTSFTDEDFDLIEALTDQHGNNLLLRHPSE